MVPFLVQVESFSELLVDVGVFYFLEVARDVLMVKEYLDVAPLLAKY